MDPAIEYRPQPDSGVLSAVCNNLPSALRDNSPSYWTLSNRQETKTASLWTTTNTIRRFWATFSKTVRPMLSDSCLSCLSLLSVTLTYCGQTVGWIKMKLGLEIGIGPGHIVWHGDSAPPPQKRTSAPQFSAYVCCGQMPGWSKMPLCMEVGLGPGDIVLDGDLAP